MFFISASSVGNDFFFGLALAPENLIKTYDVIIGTPANQASYSIVTADGEIATGTVSSSSSDTITLDSNLEVTTSGFENRMRGIRVRATGEDPVTVLVTIRYSTFLFSYIAYLVHPNAEFPNQGMYEYYTMSTDYQGQQLTDVRQSNVLLVGNQDDTMISIAPTQDVMLPQDAQSDSPLVNVAAGDTHIVMLSTLQTLTIPSLLDLTGTKIVSDKPLTVLSGHQCAQFPSTAPFCEPVYVQIPPTILWGQLFFLPPLSSRSIHIYRLVTSEDSTTVAFRCGTDSGQVQISNSAGDSQSISAISDGNSDPYCYLTASSPIFVVQMAPSFAVDFEGDPGMATVSPLTGHVQSTSFTALDSSNFPNTFITVTVTADENFDETQIQLDGTQLACSWNDILDINNDTLVVGHGCTAAIESGNHVVSHTGADGRLSVMVYGWNTSPQIGYVYLTGFNLTSSVEAPTSKYLTKDTSIIKGTRGRERELHVVTKT